MRSSLHAASPRVAQAGAAHAQQLSQVQRSLHPLAQLAIGQGVEGCHAHGARKDVAQGDCVWMDGGRGRAQGQRPGRRQCRVPGQRKAGGKAGRRAVLHAGVHAG